MEKGTYLSYLMGARDIQDEDLTDLGIQIVEQAESGKRKLKIPKDRIEEYKNLIRKKIAPGFWNEFLNEDVMYFIFKFQNGEVKEYALSSENEQEIGQNCSALNNDPPEKTANVFRYISDNDFYHGFMMKHYQEMVERV